MFCSLKYPSETTPFPRACMCLRHGTNATTQQFRSRPAVGPTRGEPNRCNRTFTSRTPVPRTSSVANCPQWRLEPLLPLHAMAHMGASRPIANAHSQVRLHPPSASSRRLHVAESATTPAEADRHLDSLETRALLCSGEICGSHLGFGLAFPRDVSNESCPFCRLHQSAQAVLLFLCTSGRDRFEV